MRTLGPFSMALGLAVALAACGGPSSINSMSMVTGPTPTAAGNPDGPSHIAMPAGGGPVVLKNLCKGPTHTYSVVVDGDDGASLAVSVTMPLSWRNLFPSVEALSVVPPSAFRNQGGCVSHVNHELPVYATCQTLLDAERTAGVSATEFDRVLATVGCLRNGRPRFSSWIAS